MSFTLNPSRSHFDSERSVKNLFGSTPLDLVILNRRLRNRTPKKSILFKLIRSVIFRDPSFVRLTPERDIFLRYAIPTAEAISNLGPSSHPVP